MKPQENNSSETAAPTGSSAGCLLETGPEIVKRLSVENFALKAENAALKSDVKAREDAAKLIEAEESIILEKMSVGLSREQAISVIRHQKAFDPYLLAANLK